MPAPCVSVISFFFSEGRGGRELEREDLGDIRHDTSPNATPTYHTHTHTHTHTPGSYWSSQSGRGYLRCVSAWCSSSWIVGWVP